MICDTSVLVDIDRGGVDDRVSRLDDTGRHAISAVSVTELFLGINMRYEPGSDQYREAVTGTERLLARFEIEPIGGPVATAAAEIIAALRDSGDRLDDLHDIYIAATARVRNTPVLTANVEHFERVDDVDVIDWSTF